MKTKDIARLGLLLALALLLGYVESLINFSFLFPGAKIGLANAVNLLILYFYKKRDFVIFAVARVVLSALLFTGFGPSFYISSGGALFSIISVLLVTKFTKASIYGISVVSATFHGLGQVVVVSLLYNAPLLLNYALATSVIGFIAGTIVAALAANVLRRISSLK